jgi:hypothetical protein
MTHELEEERKEGLGEEIIQIDGKSQGQCQRENLAPREKE